jgi:hypothetical protein
VNPPEAGIILRGTTPLSNPTLSDSNHSPRASQAVGGPDRSKEIRDLEWGPGRPEFTPGHGWVPQHAEGWKGTATYPTPLESRVMNMGSLSRDANGNGSTRGETFWESPEARRPNSLNERWRYGRSTRSTGKLCTRGRPIACRSFHRQLAECEHGRRDPWMSVKCSGN